MLDRQVILSKEFFECRLTELRRAINRCKELKQMEVLTKTLGLNRQLKEYYYGKKN